MRPRAERTGVSWRRHLAPQFFHALGSLRNRQRCGVGSLFLGFPVAKLGSVSRLYTADAQSTSAASGCGLENRDQSRQAVGARIARVILDRLWGWKLAPSCHNHDPKIVEFIWESPINGECGSRNGWTEEVYRSKRSGSSDSASRRAGQAFQPEGEILLQILCRCTND
jgi:hypothetical protein